MITRGLFYSIVVVMPHLIGGAPAMAQIPNHPIITEVYTDPPGLNDAPIGRDPSSLHQEYIELYLPPASALDPLLNKDALRLTFYEVEGDSSSSGNTLVNYRFDLPPIDLDPDPPSGLEPGSIPRPQSGIVVLGWVDYVGDPPYDLAGADSKSRIGLVNGGITATPAPPDDYLFIAINGHHFSGTLNFAVLEAENLIGPPPASNELRSGVIQNGSAAYLLVNRDSGGYVELCDDKHASDCAAGADPNLPNDALYLSTTALLDGFACNDDALFNVIEQPYTSPTGNNIDLEDVLPRGGAFSMLIPQIPEIDIDSLDPGIANGYARVYADVPKTTENGSTADDDPVQDAQSAYRHIRNDGPFNPTPGRVVFASDPPEVAIASETTYAFEALALTTREAPFLAANVGGDFPIDIAVTLGSSSDGNVATFTGGASADNVTGQSIGIPTMLITAGDPPVDGATATATATVTAANSVPTDPTVVGSGQIVTATATVINPKTGMDELGQPRQATVFLAVQPIPADAILANEFLGTDLGAYVAANLGTLVRDTRGVGALLVDPTTNLNNGFLMQSLIKDFPDPGFYINYPGPGLPGKLDLVQTVLQSPEVLSGATTYDATIAGDLSGLRAIRMNHPDTLTFDGTFTPSELLYFADATGGVAKSESPFSAVTTSRTFELAIFDTNTRDNNTLETGATDDFGLVVEVAEIEPGAPVVVGEYVFLSFSGGLSGADIDSVDTPPHDNIATLIYLDLDNLHTELGIRAIELIFVIDGDGSGELDVIDVFSLNPVPCPPPCNVCSTTNPPQLESPAFGKNRYLSFTDGNPGQQTAIRVTFANVPPPHDAATGRVMWLGPPQTFSENAGKVDPADSPGFPTFTGSRLQCDPFYTNWSLYGTIHAYDEGIVPGGQYELQAIDVLCDVAVESDFSATLTLAESGWGDVVGNCATAPCSPPDGIINITTDVTAVLNKFKNINGAPIKARSDLDLALPDQRINISDVTNCLEAFRGEAYPFSVGADPCAP